jgi:uncharacterized membrane protein YfcA
MKILIKSILIIILALIMIIIPIQETYSKTIDPADYEANELKKSDIGPLETLAGKIAGLVQIVGTIVSVGVLMLKELDSYK